MKDEQKGDRRTSKAPPSRQRAQRLTSEQQEKFRNRSSEATTSTDAWRKSTQARAPRESRDRDNVNLYLSERMLELATELAAENRMGLRDYLTEALKYVLLVQGKRLGKSDKYVPEFVNTNPKKISTWKSDSVKAAESPQDDGQGSDWKYGGREQPASDEGGRPYRRRTGTEYGARAGQGSGYGSRTRSEGQGGGYGARSRSEGQGTERKYGARARSEGQGSGYGARSRSEGQGTERKYGSRARSEGQGSGYGARSRSEGQGTERKYGSRTRSEGQGSGYGSRSRSAGSGSGYGSRTRSEGQSSGYGSRSRSAGQGTERKYGSGQSGFKGRKPQSGFAGKSRSQTGKTGFGSGAARKPAGKPGQFSKKKGR